MFSLHNAWLISERSSQFAYFLITTCIILVNLQAVVGGKKCCFKREILPVTPWEGEHCSKRPFHETVTWNNNTLLDGKRRTVRGNFKQRDYIIQKANILSFQGPTASFAIQQGVFGTRRPFWSWKGLISFHYSLWKYRQSFPVGGTRKSFHKNRDVKTR